MFGAVSAVSGSQVSEKQWNGPMVNVPRRVPPLFFNLYRRIPITQPTRTIISAATQAAGTRIFVVWAEGTDWDAVPATVGVGPFTGAVDTMPVFVALMV